jgi:hypothetical protein
MNSAISLAAVANTDDLDAVLVLYFEEDAVIAAAQAKVSAWRLQFLYGDNLRTLRS